MYTRTVIVGHVGREPVLRKLPAGGTAVTDMRVATSDVRFDRDGNKIETTEWFTVVLFGRNAEFAVKYARKGRLVLVEGIPKTRRWVDRDGQERHIQEIVGREFRMLTWIEKPEDLREEFVKPHERSDRGGSDRRFDGDNVIPE